MKTLQELQDFIGRLTPQLIGAAIEIADDAARSDLETHGHGVKDHPRAYHLVDDAERQIVHNLDHASPFLIKAATYLIGRGLAEITADAEGVPAIRLHHHLFNPQ